MKKGSLMVLVFVILLFSFLFRKEIYNFIYDCISRNEYTEIITESLEYQRTLNAVVKSKYEDGKVKIKILNTEVVAEVHTGLFSKIETGDSVRVREYKIIDNKTKSQKGIKYEIVR